MTVRDLASLLLDMPLWKPVVAFLIWKHRDLVAAVAARLMFGALGTVGLVGEKIYHLGKRAVS